MFLLPANPRKPDEHLAARLLRARGEPLKRIASRLNVSVSTVLVWTRDIELTREQRQRNLTRTGGPADPVKAAARAETWSQRHRERRRSYQQEGRDRARLKDPQHMAGCMLFWAEGAKARNQVKFVNSDAELMRFFCRFLRESLELAPKSLRVSLNVYVGNGLTIDEIEAHWLGILDLDASCLRKHTLNHLPTSSSGRKKNRLPYGVCSVSVHSTRIVQHIYGAIQEYASFEQPLWLDCRQ